jgi:hypothetical protein
MVLEQLVIHIFLKISHFHLVFETGSHYVAQVGLELLFFSFSGLGLELRAYILSHFTSPFFVLVGSQELFSQAGFELRSS